MGICNCAEAASATEEAPKSASQKQKPLTKGSDNSKRNSSRQTSMIGAEEED